MIITYTPLREIVGGGGSITAAMQVYEFDPKTKADDHEPLEGGQGETVFYNQVVNYNCQSDLIPYSQIQFWREWEASTAAGEIFNFDPWGNASTPGDYQLIPGSYDEQRQGRDRFVVSWKMKELVAPIGGAFGAGAPGGSFGGAGVPWPLGTISFWKFEEGSNPTSNQLGPTHTLVNAFGGTVGFDVGSNGSGTSLHVNKSGVQTYYALPSTDWALTDYSIIFSAKRTGLNGESDQTVLKMMEDSFDHTGWAVIADGTTGTNYRMYHVAYGEIQAETLGFTPDPDVWYRIAFTYDATAQVAKCYVNGALVDDNPGKVTPPASNINQRLYIGSFFGGNAYFVGMLDEVLVVDQVMDAASILHDYNNL